MKSLPVTGSVTKPLPGSGLGPPGNNPNAEAKNCDTGRPAMKSAVVAGLLVPLGMNVRAAHAYVLPAVRAVTVNFGDAEPAVRVTPPLLDVHVAV